MPDATVRPLADIARAIRARQPRLGAIRLVAIDGAGGAGKSTLARRLAHMLGAVPVLHTDDFASPDDQLEWWPRLEAEALAPLARGEAARFRATDWVARAPGPELVVEPAPIVILEGVSSARRAVADRLSFAIWVEAPPDRRLARGLERDGEAMRPAWDAWMAGEDAHYAADRTRERADLVVDGDPRLPHDPTSEVVELRWPRLGTGGRDLR